MSVSGEVDVLSPLSERQSAALNPVSKSSSDSQSLILEAVEAGQGDKNESSEPSTPKAHPMAFTIDFGDGKSVDNRRLEELAKKSQARHQRVQSMSASFTRVSPATQRPPLSGKLPRKAQGYNSEGYFSSDQEDSGLSGSIKTKSNSVAQTPEKMHNASPVSNRHIKSPVNDSFLPRKSSKSPIVDSIMSRSDNFTSRQGLNLPLKSPNSSLMRDRTPSYGNLSSSYQHRHVMADIVDKSPEAVMLTDISSPELDILTPDNGLSTPETAKSPIHKVRTMSETPDLLFKKCTPKTHTLYIHDDVDRESNNSSTGTYTIEGDNYTEEQKARMSIDRTFGTDIYNEAIANSSKHSVYNEKDPELIFDFQLHPPRSVSKESVQKSPIKTVESPSRVSKEKNVLEISCSYESPNENDLAAQTSKQIKSTRSYLEKIKNRVRTITEKTFAKSPPTHVEDVDLGCFTSVTTSGVLSSKNPPKPHIPSARRCSLSKSEIDKTDYIHRLSRESSVPVSLHSMKIPALDETKFESSALKAAQKQFKDEKEITPEEVVGKLSFMSLNRCKGDKTWIQEWAESVKKYNNDTLTSSDSYVIDDRPPMSPRHLTKPRSAHGETPSKIPSPVGTLLSRRTPDLIPTQDTESYLLKTQNAISNLQAKLQSNRNYNFNPLTSSLISEKTAASRLPVSQLSRSNSLNYRLRRKEASADNSPLRSPGHYVITGSTKLPESTRILLNSASRSLDTDRKDLNMNSPNSERNLSYSSDDKTLSNRPQIDVDAVLSPHRKTHSRHKSFDGRISNDYFGDFSNANQNVCLKTVLKNNALETGYPRIEPTRCLDTKKNHQRVLSDGNKQFRPLPNSNTIAFGMSIKRSSSFNTVNKNNNYIEPQRIVSRRSSGHSEECRTDYLSDESDNTSYDKSKDMRFKRQVYKGRIDAPDLKSIAPANSPRCPNTPEMQRKFGPGLVRNSVRVTNKERAVNTRMSEPPIGRDERAKSANHQSRKISEPTRQSVFNRLTKSRSSTREIQPKNQVPKKPAQYRSSSGLASKEIEFTNWKKRSSYDPMKAAREARKNQLARKHDCKDDLSSPSHSSPVHRSQSFHTTNIADLQTLDYSSEETEDDQMTPTLSMDAMVTSTHSDILELRPAARRRPGAGEPALARDYVAGFQINQLADKKRPANRGTFIMDEITPTRENIDFLTRCDADKRKTFILDSDTNSTANGSSGRTSLISQEKAPSDAELEAGERPDRPDRPDRDARRTQRYSGDYSMSSSTTSISQKKAREVQPRYLDISKYKSDNSPKNFLRRDPSKTYVGVLGTHEKAVSKGSAQHYEMEQKKQELEKWKRRASYDPRKSAAQGKSSKAVAKPASNVLRSQSFHGPVLGSTTLRYNPQSPHIQENYDANSDNDF